uniref:Secreted protein n=1 Tax=Heterorhabditis bacteriophora TaxID=37862 RepID=A0A1I7W6K7_HETBA
MYARAQFLVLLLYCLYIRICLFGKIIALIINLNLILASCKENYCCLFTIPRITSGRKFALFP